MSAPTIAVSTWSLHRTVGLMWWDKPDERAVEKEAYGKGSVAILDLPAAVAAHGINRLQLGHFHVAARERSWLAEFRIACKDAGVRLQTLLIDDGDIAVAANHKRDIAMDWSVDRHRRGAWRRCRPRRRRQAEADA